jgi:hypothetical protein
MQVLHYEVSEGRRWYCRKSVIALQRVTEKITSHDADGMQVPHYEVRWVNACFKDAS